VKPHLPAGFIKADDAVDFVRRQRVTEFAVGQRKLQKACWFIAIPLFCSI
jgi:hypothetical protein